MMQKSMLDARRFIRRMCWLASNPLVLSIRHNAKFAIRKSSKAHACATQSLQGSHTITFTLALYDKIKHAATAVHYIEA